jgi:hypothetical protein
MAGAFTNLEVLRIFHAEDRFARDSPLEEDGSKLLVARVARENFLGPGPWHIVRWGGVVMRRRMPTRFTCAPTM